MAVFIELSSSARILAPLWPSYPQNAVGPYATLRLEFLFPQSYCEKVKKKYKRKVGWAGTERRPHGETRLCSYHSNSATLTWVIRNTCSCLEENILYNEHSVCERIYGVRGVSGDLSLSLLMQIIVLCASSFSPCLPLSVK